MMLRPRLGEDASSPGKMVDIVTVEAGCLAFVGQTGVPIPPDDPKRPGGQRRGPFETNIFADKTSVGNE